MNLRVCAVLTLLFAAGPGLARAQDYGVSVVRLDLLDEHGYFTPDFKSAVHHLVATREALARARAEEQKFREELPGLRKDCADATAQTLQLREELATYSHPEIADLDALRTAMKDPAIAPEERLALAEIFVWSYPADPNRGEASTDLLQIQKQIGTNQQQTHEATVARIAARAALLRRAKAGELSLREWRDFLNDMSQEDLLALLGAPQSRDSDHWIYTGNWSTDPETKKRSGLRIDFNGTRVLGVVPADP